MGVIIRQSIKGTIVNYIGAALGMLTGFIVFTGFLTPEEIGLTQVFVRVGVLFASLAQIGTNSSILRFFPYFKDPESKNHGFFFWTLIIPFIGFIIYLSAFLIFKNFIADFFSKESALLVNYLYFTIPLGFFMLYQIVFEINAVVLHRIVVPIFVKEIGIRLMLLVFYLLFAFHYISLTGLIIALCGTYGVAACINLGYLFSLRCISLKPNFSIAKHLRKDFLYYTLFLMGSALTTAIIPNLGSFIVASQLGLAFAGIYVIAQNMATTIEIPSRSLNAISNPHISQTLKDNDLIATNRLIKKVSLHQFLVGSAILFAIWTNINVIFQIIPNGENFISGKWVVFFLGISILLHTSLLVGGATLALSKYYYFSLFFTLILTVSALVFNVTFISIFGISGAALAALASYLIYHTMVLSLVYWKLKVSPLSWAHLKTLIIILVLFGVDYIWKQSITQVVMQYFEPSVWITVFEALARTIVLGGIGFLSVYFWNVSVEVNALVKRVILKIKQKAI
ncbi:MAG: lipopolysaccharide biosynthesis protein [Bacteroidetes bacterium]|nr:lipopolysaccharide biosynthesis protein [Bacteroidota bacterium]MCL2301749.1 lipopolysaccharide biosynthesis protein [Lentimicrobiaceae bacterium]